MRKRHAVSLLLALTLSGCGAAVTTSPARQSTLPEGELAPSDTGAANAAHVAALQEVLDSFESLGVPSIAGHQFVKVWTGRETGDASGDVVPDVQYGFLMASSDTEFRVLHLLDEMTYSTEWGGVHYEPTDLGTQLDQEILAARADAQSGFRTLSMVYGYGYGTMSPRLRLLVLARAARVHGLDDRARVLLQLAAQAPGLSMPLGSESVADEARGDLALVALSQTLGRFQDESVPREVLHDGLVTVTRRFPNTEASILAEEYRTQLEAAMNAPVVVVPDESAPVDQQIAGLVYALQDYGTASGYAYWQRLAAFRHAAVPALLRATTDQRLTRAAMGGAVLPTVGRVCDVALWILRELAQRPFETVEQAETWWQSVQGRSETELLLREIRQGGYESTAAATRLLEVDPATGVREVTAAARRATEPYLRARLVSVLAQAPGEAQIPFLVEEATNSSGALMVRIEAADGLQSRGDSRWIEPFYALVRDRLADINGQDENSYMLMRVLHMLVQNGGPRGIELVERASANLDASQRIQLISALSTIPADGDVADHINGLLVASLDDAALTFDYVGYGGSSPCGAQRVGDVVARMLAERLGGEFDCTLSAEERARARATLRNRYREAHGEAALPVPARSTPPDAASASEVTSARASLLAARNEADVAAAIGRFETLGLAGAGPLDEAAEQLPDGHPGRARAVATASRLASTVSSFEIVTGSGTEFPDRARFEALRGQPLAASQVLEAFVAAVRANRRGTLVVEIDRDDEGRGARVRIELSSRVSAYAAMQSVYRWTIRSSADSAPASNSGYTDTVRLLGLRPWRQFAERLDATLAAPRTVGSETYLQLEWGR